MKNSFKAVTVYKPTKRAAKTIYATK